MARKRITLSIENYLIITYFISVLHLELSNIHIYLEKSISEFEMEEFENQVINSIVKLSLQILEDLYNLNLNSSVEFVKIPEDILKKVFRLFDNFQKLINSAIKQSEINNLMDESEKNKLLSTRNCWNSIISHVNLLLLNTDEEKH